MTPRLNVLDGWIKWEGGSIHLAPLDAQLLGLLVNGKGRTLSYGTIETGLWPHDQDLPGDPRNNIIVRIHHLRQRLTPVGLAHQIVAVPGIGYKFEGAIEVDWSDAL